MKRKNMKKAISIIISFTFVIICAMPTFAYPDGRFIPSKGNDSARTGMGSIKPNRIPGAGR